MLPSDMDPASKAIRFLAVDMIQRAGSGHPGLPLGMADIALILWENFLHVNPNNPKFYNRDRFVLSNGHGSALLYALLHLTGFALSIEDLKAFRTLHSKTPGHPELDLEIGIETSTGPLGQGLANGVGMALAEKILAAHFNRPALPIIDHYTYVFLGDGCLMEGISHEAASLAGVHRLNKLIVFWDDNGISIDGEIKDWCTDDTAMRFRAYGWEVLAVDGHDYEGLSSTIAVAKQQQKPILIQCKTHIGFGSIHFVDDPKSHGMPLGLEEIQEMREQLAWHHPPFEIPEELYQRLSLKAKGAQLEKDWQDLWVRYQAEYPGLAEELERRLTGRLPIESHHKFQAHLEEINDGRAVATRKASQRELNFWGEELGELLGGSADLTPSTLTRHRFSIDILPSQKLVGNYLHYGVREFGMFAVMNGLALHGGFIPYGGGFLVFVGYGESAVRMSAMMQQKVIYVFTHDSIGVGEDGPTHQPIEHLTMLRAIPRLQVCRPANGVETAIAWKAALSYAGPTALILTRQEVAGFFYAAEQLATVEKGGYIVWETGGAIEYLLLASGSELPLALKTARYLADKEKMGIRVVSIWSQEIFDSQPKAYREWVLPSNVTKRVAVEAGHLLSWYKYVGLGGAVLGLEDYGASAPESLLFEHFGFNKANLIKIINGLRG